jgi:AcrR family transcriptional regulator
LQRALIPVKDKSETAFSFAESALDWLKMASSVAPASRPRPSVPPPTRDTREFAQERARATYESLIRAAGEVFADKGFDDAQTPDIARAAGVSVGTFYRYFSDKRQAFIEMIQLYLDESYERVMKNLTPEAFEPTKSDSDRRATIDHVIDVLFDNTAQNPELHRVFVGMSLRDPEVSKIRVAFEERSRRALAVLIAQIVPCERIPDPLAAAEVIQIASQEIALATIGLHGESTSLSGSGALRRALSDMLYRYVFG